jgi:hypothetical protein
MHLAGGQANELRNIGMPRLPQLRRHRFPTPRRILPGILALTLTLLAVTARSANDPDYVNPEEPPLDPAKAAAALADTVDIQHVVGDSLLVLRFSGDTLVVPYFANLRVDEPHAGITRSVVVIHGTLRNARDYYQGVRTAAEAAPGADSTCLMVAPQFLTEADVAADTLSAQYPYWAYLGWRQGDHSLSTVAHPRPARFSSFAVVDSLLLRLAALNPALEDVVVAGHSAGGQFLNRYAAGNQVHETLFAEYGITVHYLVSNPSSYLYFDAKRWVPGTEYQFAVPYDQLAVCANYDKYKYGLVAPNEYMNIGSAVLRANYAARPVSYLLGGNDIDPFSAYLEKNCEAMLQGEFRLQRGLLYRAHLVDTFGPGVLPSHFFAVVPDVGHDQRGIFASACGVYTLFGAGSCTPNLPDPSWQDVTTLPLRSPSGRAVAWGDYDGDARPDLFVSAADGADKLFRNGPGGIFADATVPPLIDPSAGMSATWIDYDNNGRLDLYATNWRGPNRLYRNDGNGSFTDQPNGPLSVNGDFNESEWADLDGDGDLDAVLTRAARQGNILVRNDGNGVFTDITPPVLADTFATRDASWIDVDQDGDPDLYLVYADRNNRLLLNDGGLLSENTPAPLDDSRFGSSACWGDYDNDGDLDVYLARSSGSSKLLRNDGPAGFEDVTTAPLNVIGPGRSASWGDYDNDGDLDLYVVFTGQKNRLFRNDGPAGFADATAYPLNDVGRGWSAAWADYDGDGRLDLYLGNDGSWNKIFRNENGGANHWLAIDLRGVQSNSFGVGARIRVVAGGRTQVREVGRGTGYLSQNQITVHFGLGAAATVDSLTVYWPSGIVQHEIPGFAADRRVTIPESTQPAGTPGGAAAATSLRFFAPAPNPCFAATGLALELPEAGPVRARLFDPSGRLIHVLLATTNLSAGHHRMQWNGIDADGRVAPSGVYFCRVEAGGRVEEFRIVLLR